MQNETNSGEIVEFLAGAVSERCSMVLGRKTFLLVVVGLLLYTLPSIKVLLLLPALNYSLLVGRPRHMMPMLGAYRRQRM